MTLRSVPAGAAVLEDGVIIGKTPLEQHWTRNTVKTVTFQLAGYKDLQKAFKLQNDETIDVELEPAAKKPGKPIGKKDKDKPDPSISAFE